MLGRQPRFAARDALESTADTAAGQAAAQACLGDDLGGKGPQAPGHVVALHRDGRGEAGEGAGKVLHRRRVERCDHQHGARGALASESVRGGDGVGGDGPRGQQEEVTSLADQLGAAEPEPAVEAVHTGRLVLAHAVVDGARQVPGGVEGRRGLLRVGGADHGEPWLQAHDADVLEGLVGRPRRPVVEGTSRPHDAHGQVVQDGAVADELVGPEGGERCDRIHEGDEPGLRQTGRQTHHVLLGHTGVEEAVRVAVGEGLDHREAQVAGDEEDPGVTLGDLGEFPDERPPHSAALTSSTARSYSWSDMGK